MRRVLPGGVELDDDRERVDLDAVHSFLSRESYWARGCTRDAVRAGLQQAARVVGLYDDGRQVGFARIISDGKRDARLCDVYVLAPYRGRGLGVELVREAVDNDPHAKLPWTLATDDAHGLYRRFGFRTAEPTIMRRPAAP